MQWRQLVELVGRGAGATDPDLLNRALERIAELTDGVPDPVRALAARAIAGPHIPVALVTLFVDRTEVAVPLLATADFDSGQWAEIRSKASPDVQELMDLLRPAAKAEVVPEASASPPPEIEEPLLLTQPALPSPALFRWECGPTGEIDWVEGAPRAALIGRSIADDFQQRFAARLPFSEEPLAFAEEGELAGDWKWTGTPAFFPETGRFAGYHGSAKRGDGLQARESAGKGGLDSHRLRELIHELRTPLTAIIGFGEIIEGQLLGPAHRAYRNRAGEIVRQARRLLTAVDDLDLAAKLQSARGEQGGGTPVGEMLDMLAADIRPQLADRNVQLYVRLGHEDARIRLQRDLAQRLLNRFVEAVTSVAEEGEELILTARTAGDQVGILLNCPRALRGIDEEELLDPGFSAGRENGLGTGFALRLVRGLATIAGGGLRVEPGQLVLSLPSAVR